MKTTQLHFVFLFLAFTGSCIAQAQGATTTHETAAYSITYPTKSELRTYKNEEKDLFKSLFSLYDFGSNAIADFSGISLSKLDCSGIGIKAVIEVTERGKTVTKSWNEHSQSAFDELIYEDDGYTFVKHLYIEKENLYQLTGSIKTDMFPAHYKDMQKIMASFFLK